MSGVASGAGRVRLTIILLSLAAFASAASMRVTDAMLPRISRDLHIGLSQAASVITVFTVAYGVMQVVFGPLGDRFGKLRVIALASMGAAVGSLACVLIPGFDGFVASRLVTGGVCGAIIPLAMAWIGDVVPYEGRQAVIAQFLLGQIIGLGAGAAVGGIAAEQVEWRWPFEAIAAWFLVVGVALLFFARGDPSPRKRDVRFVGDLMHVLDSRWARIVIGTVFVEGMLVFGALAFVPTHLHEARGFALSRAGLALITFAAGGVGFALFARPIIRRLGEVWLAIWGTVFLAAGLALVAWTPVSWAAPAGCLFSGLGFYMLHNTLQANATQMSPERRGAGMALFASMLFLGQSVGVAGAGYLADAWGAMVVLALAAMALVPLGFAFAALRKGRPAS